MPYWTELAPFFALGLLGSLHCVGMCGGFALAVAASAGPGRRRMATAGVLHGLGKALTYAVLGAALAGSVDALSHAGADWLAGSGQTRLDWLAKLRRAAAWIGWAVFCALTLRALGVVGRGSPGLARHVPGARWIGHLSDQVAALPRRGRGFFAGLVNGLLPCGLTAAALALAAGGGAARGALGMFAFGLGTLPALSAVALGAASFPGPRRAIWLRWAAPLALGLGLLTAWRAGEAPCCAEEPRPPIDADAGRWGEPAVPSGLRDPAPGHPAGSWPDPRAQGNPRAGS